jgi:hypothetical protein
MPPEPGDPIDDAFRLLMDAGEEPGASVPDLLYARWFHAGGELWRFPSAAAFSAATFLPSLFQGGWHVVLPARDTILAAGPDGRQERLPAGGFALEPPAAAPVAGTGLRRLARTADAIGGFWHLWSDGWRRAPPRRMVRLYLPLRRGTELEAARRLLPALPPDATWAAKFLAGMHLSGRLDPALIYLPEGGETGSFVAPAIERMADLFGGAPVRLARPFGRAWLAPDPNDGRSFGQALSEILARAWSQSDADPAAFRALACAGLAPLMSAIPGDAHDRR